MPSKKRLFEFNRPGAGPTALPGGFLRPAGPRKKGEFRQVRQGHQKKAG
jgi:hypothetical protein